MKKSTFFLMILFYCFYGLQAMGQSQYTITGSIQDSATQQPLPLATVYVKKIQDTSLVGFALTDKNGKFSLSKIPSEEKLSFMVYYTGYKRYKRELYITGKDTLKMGKIRLSMSSNTLNEVTVIGDKPPIAIKGDTIEFNASSFHTRPNSVLAGLLKKLPGVDLDKDGNITANGKRVDKILVNGKKFFGNDPQIALQNLPAAIVDKVQITDTKSRKEELTGTPAKGQTKTINITLKKGKDHGFFGRAYAGYGTGKHYDASALVNYFNGDRQISLLGSANNINRVGFTRNEIINVMGGWDNGVRSVGVSSDGSFSINGIDFGGGGEGIKRSTTTGLNYNDDLGKHFSFNASYFYGDIKTDNKTQTARQNILPDSLFYYNSNQLTHNDNLSNRFSGTFHYKDSLLNIYYEPNISLGHIRGTSQNMAASKGEKNHLINQSKSFYTANENNKYFSNQLSIFRAFKKKGNQKKGPSIFLGMEADNRLSEDKDYNKFQNIFYDGSSPGDSANQFINNNSANDHYNGQLEYTQPLNKYFELSVGYELDWQRGLANKKTFDLNKASNKYSELDSTYSNRFRSNILTQTPQAGLTLNLDSGKWRFEINADFNFIGLHHYSYTHDLPFDQNQFYISPHGRISHTLKNEGSVDFRYYSSLRQPDISELLPVGNNSNPLYVVRGNPNLKPSLSQRMNISYNKFNFQSGNLIWAQLTYNLMKNAIVNVTSYDKQLRQISTYANVDGNHEISLNLTLSKTKKEKDEHWQIKLGSFNDVFTSHAFVNEELYKSKNYRLSLSPSFTYGYKELFELIPSYHFRYQYSQYDIKALNDRENIMNQAALSATLYWPDRITFESDWTYTHNSDVAPGFRKSYWLWNASLGLDIFKKRQATIQLSVYDLLDQNISVRRQITDTFIADTQTIILRRYFMLKLIYNLRKVGENKKKEDNGPHFFFF